MGFRECCTAILAGLPDPALPLLPSMVLGASFSAVILFIVYKKQSNMPLKTIISDLFRMVFCAFPLHEHSQSGSCQSLDCVRCKKYGDVESKVLEKYEEIKSKRGKTGLKRIEESLSLIKKKHYPHLKFEVDSMNTSKKRRPDSQRPTMFYMDLAANPYWNEFDVFKMEIELLKLNFSIIFSEFEEVFEALKSGNSQGWKLNDIPKGHWCIFPFIDQGVTIDNNCRMCPNTSTMIGSLPSLMKDCVFGNACFSILYPDSHIEPHHGPTNLRLRCHLGLSVPNGCWLEVAGKQYKWQPQQACVFDDSFEHSATFVNQSSSAHAKPRAVLMLDFWHPDVTAEEKKILLELLVP
ncbi:Aspartate beta-hydroxylase domain-containing protein 2 [Halocaridina rubra]|uniref:Aspartate beta-hydroxylase domain-containing protein 2 n=1 Tax=Halocaridina rubra TaxID=373956 RepID=A0AAN8X6L9_HALRR